MASTTSLLLLLLLLLSFPHVLCKTQLLYQTLILGSLTNPSSLHPQHSNDLTFTETSTSNTQRSTSLHLYLHYRDTLLPSNSTPTHLFHLRLLRDSSRASLLQSLAAGSFNATIISGLKQGSGEYFTRIGIGTPPTHTYMVLDTGSDVVWLQCSPCHRCYPQSDPIFDPTKSRSFAAVPCFSALCGRLDVAGCDIRKRSCLYQVSYGDGSTTTGEFSTETLTFHGGVRVGRVALGCGHDNEGLFVAAGGLLGLGRGRLSFPSQVGRRFGRRFSYCLVDRTSTASNQNRTSTVVFGVTDDDDNNSSSVVYTPMVNNPRLDTFYYVELTGISVGGAKVAGIIGSDLKLNPVTGHGGVIVDSGTSVTRLTRPAYVALRDAFRAGTEGLKAAERFSLFDTCYDLSGREEVKVPTVVMHLRGGGKLSLPAENYLIPVDKNGVFCFAFAGTDSGISIIGNIQQQGFRVVVDGSGSKIGYKGGGYLCPHAKIQWPDMAPGHEICDVRRAKIGGSTLVSGGAGREAEPMRSLENDYLLMWEPLYKSSCWRCAMSQKRFTLVQHSLQALDHCNFTIGNQSNPKGNMISLKT